MCEVFIHYQQVYSCLQHGVVAVHRIIECVGLEGTWKPIQFQPPAVGRAAIHWIRLPSIQFLNVCLRRWCYGVASCWHSVGAGVCTPRWAPVLQDFWNILHPLLTSMEPFCQCRPEYMDTMSVIASSIRSKWVKRKVLWVLVLHAVTGSKLPAIVDLLKMHSWEMTLVPFSEL